MREWKMPKPEDNKRLPKIKDAAILNLKLRVIWIPSVKKPITLNTDASVESRVEGQAGHYFDGIAGVFRNYRTFFEYGYYRYFSQYNIV